MKISHVVAKPDGASSFGDYFDPKGATWRVHALGYGAWLRDNCLVTRDGFRGSKPETWNLEMTNEEAYEMYLESLKNKL